MKEFLSERGVEYSEYNVEDDLSAREKMIAVSGHTTIPTIQVGDEVVVGFDPKRLARLLS